MSRSVLRREELVQAVLDLGASPLELADYATTGLRIVAVGPSGIGKSNLAMLIAEQLAAQGWVCVLIDPEGEIESLFGKALESPEALGTALERRDNPFLVVSAKNASEFIPYAETILAAADKHRKPLFVVLDEGQLFSASRGRKNDIGTVTDLMNDIAQRGRKRALDFFITAHRFSGTLHRSVFANANLTLIGRQEDPTAWSALAPQFRGSQITFSDLAALAPGEFFVFSRRGVEKAATPMAEALQRVAPKARAVKPVVPTTFSQWDRAVSEIPTARLDALSDPVVTLLSAIAGLTPQQLRCGNRALTDELEVRA